MVVSVAPADSIRTIIIREESPEAAARALRLDSIRLAQSAGLMEVHRLDSLALVRVRVQLFGERAFADAADSLAQRQIRNLELQVTNFRLVAEGGWVADLKANSQVAAVSAVAGAVACWFFCPIPGG